MKKGEEIGQRLEDTVLTKVFVGGLAWETNKDTLKAHFDKYGEIIEAVIIFDKVTGRSKGYGFVTFKEAEAAKKACEDATPVINGRRANCNLASLGARRTKSSPPATPAIPSHRQGSRCVSMGPPARWYYSLGTPPPPSPFHHFHGFSPSSSAACGYPPSYVASMGYNLKLGHSAGRGPYLQGQFQQPAYPGQGGMVAPTAVMPMYPLYHFQYHQHQQLQAMGVPTHHQIFPSMQAAGPVSTTISKATAVPPTEVEQVTSCS
ncbi:probable RNA-binding protein ARP1 [Elaeis guineensis]|uniref:Probable RNA-binding protein ARP1 n=1 Tax=Elaeis guineensis var. tenera TaxID=51953 RepID=A0A6I9RAC8_ELAGV|nr:probable RNA-binding protein ARP1 [Elaeis guineensis]